jgi:hypothetical protein
MMVSWFEFVVSNLPMFGAGAGPVVLLTGWRQRRRIMARRSTLKSPVRAPRSARFSGKRQTRILLAAASIATGFLVLAGPSSGADRLIDEKRAVGQSDSHEECAGKLVKAAAATIAMAQATSAAFPAEHWRTIVLARHRAISMTFEYRNPNTQRWSRTVAFCDDETYVLRTYNSDGPAPSAPPLPSMRQLRTRVTNTLASHDECIADLLSISTLVLGAKDIQEEEEGDAVDETRLMLSDGMISIENRKQVYSGAWMTTTTTCVGGRETLVNRSSAPETMTRPAPVRTKK